MRILIIGGTGRTGKLVIEQAIANGHQVTALVRDPSKISQQPNLHLVAGTPLNLSDVTAAFDSTPTSPPTAVIVTLNAPRKTDSPFSAPIAPPRLMADSHVNLVQAMKERGVRKIVTMSSFGVGDSTETIHWLARMLMRKTNMAAQFEDHDLVDKEMRQTNLDWVLVRPAMLADGDALPVKVLGDRGEGAKMLNKITKRSVAKFLVEAAENEQWVRRSPVIAN